MENKNVVEFFINIIPPTVTHHDKKLAVSKNGKPYMYDSMELKKVKAELRDHLAGHKPKEKLEPPIRLVVKWCFPLKEGKKNGQYMTEKPDLDNSLKTLMDRMTKLDFWKDDCHVASLVLEKFYAEITGIYIFAEEIE